MLLVPEEYQAVMTYQAQKPDELTFLAGNVLLVAPDETSDWWKANLNGKRGLVPKNYLVKLGDVVETTRRGFDLIFLSISFSS